MGIQLNLIPKPLEVNGIQFPVLAKFKDKEGPIWLFTAPEQGICIQGGKKGVRISDRLVPLTRTDLWEILPKGTSFTFTQE